MLYNHKSLKTKYILQDVNCIIYKISIGTCIVLSCISFCFCLVILSVTITYSSVLSTVKLWLLYGWQLYISKEYKSGV